MVFSEQKKWIKYLSLAKYWYNTTHHSSIQDKPFSGITWIYPNYLSSRRCSKEFSTYCKPKNQGAPGDSN
jgi:hypothetical protein